MKYIEFGIGNRWIIRTEIECPNGVERETFGVKGPISTQSVYIRIWLGNHVWIIDTVEGCKRQRKKVK